MTYKVKIPLQIESNLNEFITLKLKQTDYDLE